MKKDKHGCHCHDQWKHFSPLVLSVDEMINTKSQVRIATLSSFMAAEMEEPILYIKGWVNGRIVITVAR